MKPSLNNSQSETEFVERCKLKTEQARDALCIRSAIANLASVKPTAIRAEDRFNIELIQFEFWGSLDTIALRQELEECLGISISDRVAEKIPDPEAWRNKDMTVGEWVRAVLAATSHPRT